MEISNKFIQVRGKLEAERELNLGEELEVTVCVTDIQDTDMQDGTVGLGS